MRYVFNLILLYFVAYELKVISDITNEKHISFRNINIVYSKSNDNISS